MSKLRDRYKSKSVCSMYSYVYCRQMTWLHFNFTSNGVKWLEMFSLFTGMNESNKYADSNGGYDLSIKTSRRPKKTLVCISCYVLL